MSGRKIIHLDMDAFYASVEQRDDPALRGRPVVVGGSPGGRGVVAAASYEARRFGIRSAMSAAEAARRCPDAVFLRPDMARYRQASGEVRAILDTASELVEPLSIDEWFLDVTVNLLGLPHAADVARHLRARIRDEVGLTASCGVGPSKLVAKIASDVRKPDGLTVVPPERVLDFLHPRPVRVIWGVGPATAKRLEALGARTVGELAALPEEALAGLGKHGAFLRRLAAGEDPREVRPHRERKSRGSERTFEHDLLALDDVLDSLRAQVARVCEGTARAGQRAHVVTLKVRYDDFTTVTRSASLGVPTTQAAEVFEVVQGLLDRTDVGRRPVRLVGVSLGGLDEGTGEQLVLPFDPSDHG
ncbi:MAG: DNA polymerase IV [Alphaproteobacteria bacterium]|nr:DNA polymerase IV [Alphaproteobacteria bacterium]